MRLEKGKLYELNGRPWRCVYVDDCSAKLVPTWKERREIRTWDGKDRGFDANPLPKGLRVSPNAVLQEWPTS